MFRGAVNSLFPKNFLPQHQRLHHHPVNIPAVLE